MSSISPLIIFASLIFIAFPVLVAVLLRWSCYQYLSRLNNDLTRLLYRIDRTILSERITGIMNQLHQRYEEVSLKSNEVNTGALVDVVYAEQWISVWPLGRISLEYIDAYTRVLPNLLLSFGLIGTFFGITTNLVSLGDIINTTNASNINDLIKALQSPLSGMGVAFFSSLVALLGSAFLVTINLVWNISTERNKLINGFENYLDNIYQITLNGESRLDKTVDRMANTFEEFLIDFGDSLKKSVESALQDKIQEISNAYIKVADIAAQSYSRLDDMSSNIARSADRFQNSALILHKAVSDIHDSEFAQSLAKTTAALKATLGEFEISSQRLSMAVTTMDRSLSESQISLSDSINKLVTTQDSFAVSINTLDRTIEEVTAGTNGFKTAALAMQESVQSINDSEFAESLAFATSGFKNTVQDFQSSSKSLSESITGVQDFILASNNQLVSSTTNLGFLQTGFAKSTDNLNSTVVALNNGLIDKIENISTSYIGFASLAGQAYDRLNHVAETIAHSTMDLKDSSLIFKESAQKFEATDFDQSFQTFSRSVDTMQECIEGSTELLTKSITSLTQVQSGFEHSSSNLEQSVMTLKQTIQALSQTGQKSLAAIEKISVVAESQRAINDFHQINQQYLNDVIPKITHGITLFNELTDTFKNISDQVAQNSSKIGVYIQNKNQSSDATVQQIEQVIEHLNKISNKIESIKSNNISYSSDL